MVSFYHALEVEPCDFFSISSWLMPILSKQAKRFGIRGAVFKPLGNCRGRPYRSSVPMVSGLSMNSKKIEAAADVIDAHDVEFMCAACSARRSTVWFFGSSSMKMLNAFKPTTPFISRMARSLVDSRKVAEHAAHRTAVVEWDAMKGFFVILDDIPKASVIKMRNVEQHPLFLHTPDGTPCRGLCKPVILAGERARARRWFALVPGQYTVAAAELVQQRSIPGKVLAHRRQRPVCR